LLCPTPFIKVVIHALAELMNYILPRETAKTTPVETKTVLVNYTASIALAETKIKSPPCRRAVAARFADVSRGRGK